ITRSDSIGGASIHLLDLAKGAKDLGHEVHVFVGGDGPLCKLFSQYEIPFTTVTRLIRQISPLQDVAAYLQLKQSIKKFNPELIHAHSSKAGVLGRLIGRSLQKPCIFTAHGWAYTHGVPAMRRIIYRYIERCLAPLAKKIITVSNYDRSLALANKVGGYDQLITIYNGVRDTRNLASRKEDSENRPVRLIMVARFDDQKDQLTLV